MKSIIIYYSVSGNTRKIAQAIHKGVSQLADCDIVAIKGTKGVPGMHIGHLLEYDLIGIGSPVWCSTLPPNVLDFINSLPSFHKVHFHKTGFKRNLPFKKRKHGFFFLTHGAGEGEPMKTAWTALRGRELTVIGWKDWYGAGFSTFINKPHAAEGHPDALDLKEATDFGMKMVERSHRISRGETNLIPEMPGGEEYLKLYGQLIFKEHPKWLHHDYDITIDMEKCTRCGLCVEHCPMDNIDLEADPPVLGGCIYCTVCEMVCPVGAVDCEMERVKKDRQQGSVFGKWVLSEVEKRSRILPPERRLRWLIRPEDIGKDGYLSDVTGHPRLVIPEQRWRPTGRKPA